MLEPGETSIAPQDEAPPLPFLIDPMIGHAADDEDSSLSSRRGSPVASYVLCAFYVHHIIALNAL